MNGISSDYIAMLAFASEETVEAWKKDAGKVQERKDIDAGRQVAETFDVEQFAANRTTYSATSRYRPSTTSSDHGNRYWGGGMNKTHSNYSRTYSQTTYSQTTYRQTTYSQTTYRQTTYRQTTYRQTTYRQTTYSQTTYRQTTYSQTTYRQTTYSQTTYSQTTYRQTTYRQTTHSNTPSTTAPATTAASTTASSASSSSSTSTSTSVTPTLDNVGVNHTTKWEENRRKYNEAVDPDRSENTFWAGEKFILNATFSTTNNTNYSDTPLLKKVAIKNTSYETTTITTNASQSGKIIQTAALWRDDMMKNLKNGTITFVFTFNDGSTREKNVKIESTTNFYNLHMKQ